MGYAGAASEKEGQVSAMKLELPLKRLCSVAKNETFSNLSVLQNDLYLSHDTVDHRLDCVNLKWPVFDFTQMYCVNLTDTKYMSRKIIHESGIVPSPRDKLSCWVYNGRWVVSLRHNIVPGVWLKVTKCDFLEKGSLKVTLLPKFSSTYTLVGGFIHTHI